MKKNRGSYPFKLPLLISFLTAVVVIASGAWAQAQMQIGGEFEFVDFSVPVVLGSGLKGHEEAMADRMVKAIQEICPPPQCQETRVEGKFGQESRFQLENGFWFQISWDPNVVEVTTKPSTVAEVRAMAPVLQKLIWGSAKLAGLSPDPERRAGHFNFGAMKSFDGNALEFLKFIIDYANRPELANGIFRDTNSLNAPHLAQLGEEQRRALSDLAAKALTKPQEEKMTLANLFSKPRKHPTQMTIAEMAYDLVRHVFYETTNPMYSGPEAWHYQALGLKSVLMIRPDSDRPLENRAVRSQRDIYDFILMAELMEARIAYLKTLPKETAFTVTETTKGKFTAQELVNRYYIYVTETGLSWDVYKRLLPAKLLIRKPHPLLMVVAAPSEKSKSVKEIVEVLDLLATSPWLQKKVQEILLNEQIPYEQRELLLHEIKRLEVSTDYSHEMRRRLKQLDFAVIPGGGSMSCRALFL
ncbi:hypothetical protein AZI86_13145 [Bdellovibrio bacteriovorus]|uniref:Uncharacterized protein n=1 Tax=Bdellovibrio bacteriovorus TaxID=959 RepID=A0A150WJL3_BDEBC|nr:hypothetical protein [Bdellovibrio bacteriovorus]KYG63765.1 hypothetical protein AZI86_13145 [Bdellovibrio bacteriovorus]